jgi:predicted RNA-binding Zn ribbon-like protein
MASRNRVPEDVSLVYEFVNTLDTRSFVHFEQRHLGGDELATPNDLRGWLFRRGLIRKDVEVTTRDLETAVALREGLRSMLESSSGRRLAAKVRRQLNRLAENLPLIVRFDDAGAPSLRRDRDTVSAALASMIGTATLAHETGHWRRLKLCAAPDCRMAFYDHSKPCTGRWCVTSICGNRHNTETYRRRQTR